MPRDQGYQPTVGLRAEPAGCGPPGIAAVKRCAISLFLVFEVSQGQACFKSATILQLVNLRLCVLESDY